MWLSAAIEAEAALMRGQGDYKFAAAWLPEPRIHHLTTACKRALGLGTFYTLGEQEGRSWLFKSGLKLPDAGAVIHSDFQRYFKRADVMKAADIINSGDINVTRSGKGREYIVEDGEDVIEFIVRK